LLDRCYEVAIKTGSLDLRLETLARGAATSARMLVYHFGSKEALHDALISRFEVRLRERFNALAGPARVPNQSDRSRSNVAAQAILAVWDELTAPAMRGLLRLSVELRYRALRGDAAARRVVASETTAWRDLLTRWGLDREATQEFLMLAEGAATHLLLTDDVKPGRATLARMLRRRFRR
jgi:AcrR family transcriptional regulator